MATFFEKCWLYIHYVCGCTLIIHATPAVQREPENHLIYFLSTHCVFLYCFKFQGEWQSNINKINTVQFQTLHHMSAHTASILSPKKIRLWDPSMLLHVPELRSFTLFHSIPACKQSHNVFTPWFAIWASHDNVAWILLYMFLVHMYAVRSDIPGWCVHAKLQDTMAVFKTN